MDAKMPEKYPVVVAMCPPASYLVMVSETEGYIANLTARVRRSEHLMKKVIFGTQAKAQRVRGSFRHNG